IDHPRLWLNGLRAFRLSRGETSEARSVGERRTSRCLLHNCAQRSGRRKGTTAGSEAKGSNSAAALSGRNPGGDWWQDHRARKRFGIAQKRDGKMLRRRYYTKTQTPGETEGRKKADEKHRSHQYSAGSIY